MKPRILTAWIVSILVHVSVLVTVGAMTLAGGRPAKPGVSEIAINLSAPPAPKAAAPAPQPKAQPAPQPKPKPKPKPKDGAPFARNVLICVRKPAAEFWLVSMMCAWSRKSLSNSRSS